MLILPIREYECLLRCCKEEAFGSLNLMLICRRLRRGLVIFQGWMGLVGDWKIREGCIRL